MFKDLLENWWGAVILVIALGAAVSMVIETYQHSCHHEEVKK